MALEWKSALFVSPGKGGTAQCGLPRRGVGGGCWVNGMTSGGECWKVPLLVNTLNYVAAATSAVEYSVVKSKPHVAGSGVATPHRCPRRGVVQANTQRLWK